MRRELTVSRGLDDHWYLEIVTWPEWDEPPAGRDWFPDPNGRVPPMLRTTFARYRLTDGLSGWFEEILHLARHRPLDFCTAEDAE